MDWLKTLIAQLQTLWSGWDASQRVIMSGAAVVCVVTVGGTLYWATQPDYVVLRSNLTPQESADIVGRLEDEQISSELNFSGSSVSVSRADVARARLALKDLSGSGTVTEESSSGGFMFSPEQQDADLLHQRELYIARSIMLIDGIRSAEVMISKARESVFTRDQVPPSASVLIDPKPGYPVTTGKAQSIISLVAQGFPGLTPEQITLVDTTGRQLNAAGGADSALSTRLDFQRRVESERAQKAESMLAQMLGQGKATVQVSADIIFDKRILKQKTFDPDSKTTKSETIQKESTNNAGSSLLNGADANMVPNVLDTLGSTNETTKSETSTFEYDNGHTEEELTEEPGRVKRLTVSAIVDLDSATSGGADPAATAAASPPVTAEQVEQLIRQAVGFDELRGDEITVTIAPLIGLPPVTEAPAPLAWWDTYGPIVQWGILGVSVSSLLLVGLLLVRKMKPVQVGVSSETPLTLEEMRRVMALSDQARQNPDLVADILKTWMEPRVEEARNQAAPEVNEPQRRAA